MRRVITAMAVLATLAGAKVITMANAPSGCEIAYDTKTGEFEYDESCHLRAGAEYVWLQCMTGEGDEATADLQIEIAESGAKFSSASKPDYGRADFNRDIKAGKVYCQLQHAMTIRKKKQ